jgi:hypothetical protein
MENGSSEDEAYRLTTLSFFLGISLVVFLEYASTRWMKGGVQGVQMHGDMHSGVDDFRDVLEHVEERRVLEGREMTRRTGGGAAIDRSGVDAT